MPDPNARPPSPPPDPAILERNLRALAPTSMTAVRAIMASAPAEHVDFVVCDDGAISGSVREISGRPRQLASLRRPLEEAERWGATIDIQTNPGVVLAGFGLGHHVATLARRLQRTGVTFCFEPDLGLLRAVLERIDHSAWIAQSNFVLLTAPDDQAVMAASVQGVEGLLAAGVTIANHPPSTQRLGPQVEQFHTAFTAIMTAVRTNIVTTMVQVETALRNALMNLEHYALGPGVADLSQVAAGFPAVIVSAGPSLERNIDLLARPGVRDQVVIIATQTVLKPLLARGIRPHFVTALDYHEISRRFYEGLTATDVAGVTLVVEPQANPAILDAFPGVIRCAADEPVDQLLGADLARHMGRITPGATVAHLAYYLARHLGCDPVIMIGQDLGFTDGQYYAAGASIHRVWAGELSEFLTLEMLEWQRIVRGRNMLRKVRDALGREMYTDEQMHTYLVQFEREFLADAQRGLSVIDATEGGVAKAHTTQMTLADALASHAIMTLPESLFEDAAYALPEKERAARRERVTARVRSVRADVGRLRSHIEEAGQLVRRAVARHSDQEFVNRSISKLEKITAAATALDTAYWLVQFLNQTGTFNRFKADRAIEVESLEPLERQRRQLERDARNLQWLGEAADRMGQMLDACIGMLQGGPKLIREPDHPGGQTPGNDHVRVGRSARRVHAVVMADPDVSGLGTPRDLNSPVAGFSPLVWTLRALSRSTEVDGITLVGPHAAELHAVASHLPESARRHLRIETADFENAREQAAFRRASRLWTRRSWRGGLGGTAVFDEIVEPKALAGVMARLELDAALVVGGDWALVDPALCDQLISRFREDPDVRRLVFSQAVPGIAGCVVDRGLIDELLVSRPRSGTLSTLGALLSYIPVAPQADPIAKPNCVTLTADVRDAGVRAIADDQRSRRAIERVLERLGAGAAAQRSVTELRAALEGIDQTEIVHIHAVDADGNFVPAEAIELVLDRVRTLSRETPVAITISATPTLPGEGRTPDLLSWTALRGLVARLREVGAAGIHIRTGAANPGAFAILSELAPDITSIDFADADDSAAADLVEALLPTRHYAAGLPDRWIVPRLTRRDAVYEQVEGFVDRSIMVAGCAVLDPLSAPITGERIAPLPPPDAARERFERTILTLHADGTLSRGLRASPRHSAEVAR